RRLVLSLHERARSGMIRRGFYIVVPSLFANLEIDGDDVCISSTMKKMMLQRRRCLLAIYNGSRAYSLGSSSSWRRQR
ncbi:hypothetical protein VIGAN_06239600, partial [Vigna angularis var. angularis]